jgi:hypothetical protein
LRDRSTFPSPARHTQNRNRWKPASKWRYGISRAKPNSAIERMEHLAILKRWCYRGTRTGEIFFADNKGELPMRRLVRGIGRVYKGEAPDLSFVDGR